MYIKQLCIFLGFSLFSSHTLSFSLPFSFSLSLACSLSFSFSHFSLSRTRVPSTCKMHSVSQRISAMKASDEAPSRCKFTSPDSHSCVFV